MKDRKIRYIDEMVKDSLLTEVKKEITDQAVREMLNEFESKLRAVLRPMMEEISFQHIDRLYDMANMMHKFHIEFHWSREE